MDIFVISLKYFQPTRCAMLLLFIWLLLLCNLTSPLFLQKIFLKPTKTSITQLNALEKYCLNVKLDVDPTKREEFLDCINNNQKGTLSNEPLSLKYTWGEDESNPNVFHFHEEYIGREGFEEHTKAPHFAIWQKYADQSPSPFVTAPEVVFYNPKGSERMSKKKALQLATFWLKDWILCLPQRIMKSIDDIFYKLFLLFEQFDSNPVTPEGRRRRMKMIARQRAEEKGLPFEDPDEEPPLNILPSFTGF